MTRAEQYEQAKNAALHLADADRARLILSLLDSIKQTTPDVEEAWLDEAERRDRNMDAGVDPGVDESDLLLRLRSKLP